MCLHLLLHSGHEDWALARPSDKTSTSPDSFPLHQILFFTPGGLGPSPRHMVHLLLRSKEKDHPSGGHGLSLQNKKAIYLFTSS